MLILKTNPGVFLTRWKKIITYFPNVNTTHIVFLSNIKQIITLPDTVTSIVVNSFTLKDSTEPHRRLCLNFVLFDLQFLQRGRERHSHIRLQ